MEYKAQKLKKDLITKRCIDNDMTMDDACKEIGISKATLSRLEKSKLPDVIGSKPICEREGCFKEAVCGKYCGGHCECPA